MREYIHRRDEFLNVVWRLKLQCGSMMAKAMQKFKLLAEYKPVLDNLCRACSYKIRVVKHTCHDSLIISNVVGSLVIVLKT